MTIILASFVGSQDGQWQVQAMTAISGDPLKAVDGLNVHPSHIPEDTHSQARWVLRGTSGHVRYVERPEANALNQHQTSLGKPENTCAALIPIRKSAAWWVMTQEERREIFEAKSHHITGTLKYLPAIARRLYHSRDLGEPFDFLTWFEFSPQHSNLFDELVTMLRATPEWSFVDREVDIRLVNKKPA